MENGGNMNREESIVFAQKFLEDILSFFGVNLAVHSTVDDEIIQLSVPSSELNSLFIGRDSGNLRSLQFLISRALEAKNAEIHRVNIDVADYKKQRAQKITEKAEKWIEQVRKTVIHHEKPKSELIGADENRALLAGEKAKLQQDHYASLISH